MIARQLFAVGRIAQGRQQMAAFCSWGNHWKSFADELRNALGAPTSHGLCEECAAKLESEPRHYPQGAA